MTNSDRELLMDAARAAGMTGEYWSPLESDGDALRLASALCMNIKQDDPNAVICGWSNIQRVPFTHDGTRPWYWKEWLRDHGNDRVAATRRCIVRAAAQLWRDKP